VLRGKQLGAFALALLTAAAATGAVPKKTANPSDVAAVAKTLDCASHRFEATIHVTGQGGKAQDKTVRMCGTKGESDAEWLATLKDAVKKTAGNPQMPEATKEQIVAAVNAEIGRLSSPAWNLPQGTDIAKLSKSARTTAPDAPLSRDYAALPPLPTASSVAPPHVLGPSGALAQAAHVTVRCALIGDEDRPEACDSIDKDTVLVVRADEAYPKGLAMRFMRDGDQRAEVSLPAMASGQTAKLRLPPAVCSRVVRSKIEIQAVGANAPAGTMAGTIGEYDLRC
jgi:hypothetical protein